MTQQPGEVLIAFQRDTRDRSDLEEGSRRPPAVDEVDWRALLVQFLLCWVWPAIDTITQK